MCWDARLSIFDCDVSGDGMVGRRFNIKNSCFTNIYNHITQTRFRTPHLGAGLEELYVC